MKKLFKLALFAGIAYGVTQLVRVQKSRWEGLTEEEVRQRLDAKLAARVPQEKREMIEETVVGALRSKGKLREDPVVDEPATGEAADD